MLTKEEIDQKVASIPHWGQSIPLPYGIITPGAVMDNIKTLEKLELPKDLRGKKVLDIGAWDGFYSFECEKRGANVVAIDNYYRMERSEERVHGSLKNTGFNVVKEILNSRVDYRDLDVYDISKDRIGSFDIVLFLGVLYHLKYPLLALEKIFEVCKDMVVIETSFCRTLARAPFLYYVEGESLNNDPTNWFIPNIKCLEGMLSDVGFRKIEVIYKSPILFKPRIKKAVAARFIAKNILSLMSIGRAVIKAYK